MTATGEQMYSIRIELFARAEPLVFTAEELAATDFKAQMAALSEALEQVDVQEAEDQVHERYEMDLCAACRARVHRGLKLKRAGL